MIKDEKEIKTSLEELLNSIQIQQDHFSRIMQRLDQNQKTHRNFNHFFRLAFPAILSLVLMITMVFPVFGNEATLVDVYQNYRIKQSINAIKQLETGSVRSLSQQDVQQFVIHAVLEKDFQLTPLQIQQILSQNIDHSEIISLAIMSRLSNQDPNFLLEQRKKLNWVRVVRRNGIPPGVLIHEMRKFVQVYENKPPKTLFIRGIVEAYSPETGTLMMDGVPFKIFLLPDTRFFSPIIVGSDIEIEAVFIPESQKVGAIMIRSFDPVRAGFVSFSARITQRDRHVVYFQKESSNTEETLFLAPHIMHSPANFVIRPGTVIRFIAFRDPERGLVAIRFRPETELKLKERKGLRD